MMISPEGYYEEYLKGKTAAQIMTTIRGLKNEIDRLKNIMEHPEYGNQPLVKPSEATRLWCDRLYLERAKEALTAAGGTYTLSRAERKAANFDKNIPAINKLVFTIGGFFGGYETRTFTFTDEQVCLAITERPFIHEHNDLDGGPTYPRDKEEFLAGLRGLHIGEWRNSYDTRRFGYEVLDGTQWSLKICFANGHKPVIISGSNAYPYNFDQLEELLDKEPFFSDEEE